MTRSDTKKLILKAANLIDKHGLAKGIEEDWNGAMCIYGALSIAHQGRTAVHWDGVTHNAAIIIAKYLDLEIILNLPTSALVDWNNDPRRTKLEVVTAMRESVKAKGRSKC